MSWNTNKSMPAKIALSSSELDFKDITKIKNIAERYQHRLERTENKRATLLKAQKVKTL